MLTPKHPRNPVTAFFRGLYAELAFSGESLRINGVGLLFGLVTGLVVGVCGGVFARLLDVAADVRNGTAWAMYLLPLAGLMVVWMYRRGGIKTAGGTDLIIQAARGEQPVSRLLAPVIFAATLLTHFFGGSAGREGAALQLGGSLSELIRKGAGMGESYQDLAIMCGMSAAFSALFGTPMAAAVFALEVVSVGVMYYAALMPCMIASLIASGFAAGMGVTPESFHVTDIPALTVETGLKMGVIALGCAIVSIMFCIALNGAAGLYGRWFKNKYVRVAVGACLVIVVTFILRTDEYMGAGAELIEKAVENGQADTFAFFWKMVLTALTMRAGFRGGEIVPSFCIGATFGCVMGNLMGISPSICAACGMAAVFCGVTNCPITSILIAFEMFGFKGVSFYLIAVSISYAASGYYGLYKDQTIVYSKYKAKYVNRHTRF